MVAMLQGVSEGRAVLTAFQGNPQGRPTFNTSIVWLSICSMSWIYSFKCMLGSPPAVLRNPKVISMTDRASQASL